MARGVLSELSLEGFATVLPEGDCVQQRQTAFAKAQATSDPAERARLLESAPARALKS